MLRSLKREYQYQITLIYRIELSLPSIKLAISLIIKISKSLEIF